MGAHAAGRTSLLANLLFLAGYPAAIVVIARWVPVVREQRVRWLVVHHLGVAAIVAGWLLRDRVPSALVNATWLLASTAWFVIARRGQQRP